MRLVILPAVALAGVLLACSGSSDAPSSDRVLHLRGYDMEVDAYRTYIRGSLLDASAKQICGGFKGLSAEEILDAVLATDEGTPEITVPPNATHVTAQTPSRDDQLVAAQIVKEECERVAG